MRGSFVLIVDIKLALYCINKRVEEIILSPQGFIISVTHRTRKVIFFFGEYGRKIKGQNRIKMAFEIFLIKFAS